MRALAALLTLLVAAPAAAGERVARAPGSRPPACAPCLPLVKVNIVGRRSDGTPDDRRGPLARLGSRLGLSQAETARIRAATGIVSCDLGDGLKPLASGVLVGDGSAIATAAHVLRDPARDGVRLAPGTRCLFRNQAHPPEAVALRLDGSETLGSGGRADIWDPNDFAVVRLAAPLRNPAAVAFPLALAPNRPGTPVLLISGFQVDLRAALGDREPIAQLATVEAAADPAGGGAVGGGAVGGTDGAAPRALYLSGAMDAGGSGGAMLVRQGGRLALAAIVSTTGAVSRNGFPFSVARMSFIRVITVEGRFRNAVETVHMAQR